MKNTLKLAAIWVSLLLFGCEQSVPSKEVGTVEQRINVTGNDSQSLVIRTITLDGNEYYATKGHNNYWSLYPKLPPKVEQAAK